MVLPIKELRENPRRVVVWKAPYNSFEELEAEIGNGGRNGFYHATTEFAEMIFEKGDSDEVRYVIKPNVVGGQSDSMKGDPNYHGGIVTNPWMVDGIIQRLYDLGGRDIVVTDGGGGNDFSNFEQNDYCKMMERWNGQGPTLAWMSKPSFADYSPDEITWGEVPNGVIHKVFPFVKPVMGNEFLILAPTMKTHNLGIITMCGKGQQGVVATEFKHFCSFNDAWGKGHYSEERLEKYYQPNLRESIKEAYQEHVRRNLPFWTSYRDKTTGVSRFEPHSHRTVDVVSATNKMYEGRLFCIVEGLIGRDGTAFNQGNDHYAGLLIAGANIFEVDKVTAWLMGHDPKYIPWLVVGEDRGLGSRDIHDTEIYLLPDNRKVTPEELSDFIVPLPVILHGQSEKLGLGDILFHDDYINSERYEHAKRVMENI